jgi:hypothetical protein
MIWAGLIRARRGLRVAQRSERRHVIRPDVLDVGLRPEESLDLGMFSSARRHLKGQGPVVTVDL